MQSVYLLFCLATKKSLYFCFLAIAFRDEEETSIWRIFLLNLCVRVSVCMRAHVCVRCVSVRPMQFSGWDLCIKGLVFSQRRRKSIAANRSLQSHTFALTID